MICKHTKHDIKDSIELMRYHVGFLNKLFNRRSIHSVEPKKSLKIIQESMRDTLNQIKEITNNRCFDESCGSVKVLNKEVSHG